MNEEKVLGCWSRMRRAYLMEHRPATYSTMVMTGELWPHLYQVDDQAELILEQMQAHFPAPDRNTNPMAWVRHMNAVKAQAEEIIRRELIYA